VSVLAHGGVQLVLQTRKWDPDKTRGRYWRDDVPRNLELETFIIFFEKELGFVACDLNFNLEDGFEQIAIFCNFNPEFHSIEVPIFEGARGLTWNRTTRSVRAEIVPASYPGSAITRSTSHSDFRPDFGFF
jgi:hypothetical protein